jgi:hypothetical protein
MNELEASAATAEEVEERSPVEPAVIEGRDPGWEELLELADRVGPSAELASVDDDALQELVCTGAARLAAEMCNWLDLIAELVIRRIWAVEGCRTPAVWLSWAVGLSPSAARDHVRVALRLRELPRVREEFAAGATSYSKVRAICRVAVPETEELLLEWSRMATGADMERIVAGFPRRATGRHAAAGPSDLLRQVRLRDRGDGTSEVVIRLPDDEAHALYAGAQRLVDLETAELRRQAGLDEEDGLDDEIVLEGTSAEGRGAGPVGRGPVGRLRGVGVRSTRCNWTIVPVPRGSPTPCCRPCRPPSTPVGRTRPARTATPWWSTSTVTISRRRGRGTTHVTTYRPRRATASSRHCPGGSCAVWLARRVWCSCPPTRTARPSTSVGDSAT